MQSFFFIHLDKKFVKVNVKDIRFVLSVAHHVKIFTDQGVLMPHLSLKQLETMLPTDLFSRVNRGTLVALQRVTSFDKEEVLIEGEYFYFTDKYRKEFEEKVIILLHREGNAGKTK